MIEAEPAPPQAKMRAKLVADLVRGRHAGKPIHAVPDGDLAEIAAPPEPTPPPAEPRDQSALFFNKGVATATGFRPDFWTYRRKASAELSLVVPAEPAVAPSPASPLEEPAKPQAHKPGPSPEDKPASAGPPVDLAATLPQPREGEDAPARARRAAQQMSASGPEGVDNVVTLLPDACLPDAPAPVAQPPSAPPAPAVEPRAESAQESSATPIPRRPAPLDEIAIARLLAPGNRDPLPERPLAVEAREAEPDAPTPNVSAPAERRQETDEKRPWPAVLDERAVAELLSPGNRDAPAPAPLPDCAASVDAHRTGSQPMSRDEAELAEALPPAVEPEPVAALSAPIDPAAEPGDRQLNPLSPILGAIRRGRYASQETVAEETEKSAAFPADAPGPAENAGAAVASDGAVEATAALDLGDHGSAAPTAEPAGVGEHPLDSDNRLDSDSDDAAPAPAVERHGEISEADPTREEMIDSLGAAIESVLSERRYGSPQPARQTGLASYRSTAVETVTSSSLLDELVAARPVKSEEPPPAKTRWGVVMGVVGIFGLAMLLGYVFAKGDPGISSLVRQVTQLVS